MDLGSLFSGLGFTPPNNSNPIPNTTTNTSSLNNWIIIIIILIVAFRYGNLRSWFSPPVYQDPISPITSNKKRHKKHHKHHDEETDFNNPYPNYPPPQQSQEPIGQFNGLGI